MMSTGGTFCLVCIIAGVAILQSQISSAESKILFHDEVICLIHKPNAFFSGKNAEAFHDFKWVDDYPD